MDLLIKCEGNGIEFNIPAGHKLKLNGVVIGAGGDRLEIARDLLKDVELADGDRIVLAPEPGPGEILEPLQKAELPPLKRLGSLLDGVG